MQSAHSRAKVMIYFHGMGEDNGEVVHEIKFIRDRCGYNVISVEYPGYGLNWHAGICTADQISKDGLSVVNYLTRSLNLKTEDLVVYGRSMGAAAACNLALAVQDIDMLVLTQPFMSV